MSDAATARRMSLRRLVCWAACLLLAGIAGSLVLWQLSPKHDVLVLDRIDGKLGVAAQYRYLPERIFAGVPAAVARLAGLQPDARIPTPAGTVDLAALAVDDPDHRLIAINRSSVDVHYAPVVFGDLETLPAQARTVALRIPPGGGARLLAKTKGDYRFGCAQRPADNEIVATGPDDAVRYTVLGWFVAGMPEDCPPR